ncbi:hypothetical protein ACA910_005795 [Epithemia clementina (nom. ined.)]
MMATAAGYNVRGSMRLKSASLLRFLWLTIAAASAFLSRAGVWCLAADTAQVVDQSPPPGAQTCYEWTGSSCSWEPNLQPMKVSFSKGEDSTFYAYVTPDVSTFYNETKGSRTAVKPLFSGMFGKFINLSPDPVRVWWKGKELGYIADVEAFGSAGTATYVGHVFVVTPPNQKGKVLVEWKMQQGNSLYYYDPFNFDIHKAHKKLSDKQYVYYHMQWHNKLFAEQYKQFTGRDWLALYQQKKPPRYHMWRADYFGQTHQVVTKEIHFVELPTEEELARGVSTYGPRPDFRTSMRKYRHKDPTLTLNLTAISCSPRVFEIRNFLSDLEVEHLLHLALKSNMHRSSVSAGGGGFEESDTRTSTNSWIARQTNIITDALYRRAADLLQMDEALLRWRRASEIPEFTESTVSVAERLQCVHYEVGQQYTPHHDFVMPGLVNLQPSRFATILFYLNDDMRGGETSFPRWENAETGNQLKVKPERGKAILFYNLLPDGNYDEQSMHAALPVQEGDKWLTNLWVWDPIMDHTGDNRL